MITVLVQTVIEHNNQLVRLWPGMQVEAPPDKAAWWIEHGIAERVRPRGARPPLEDRSATSVNLDNPSALQRLAQRRAQAPETRQEITRTDMRPGAIRGTETVRGEDDAPLSLVPPEPEPEPEEAPADPSPPTPTETTGESARRTLPRRP